MDNEETTDEYQAVEQAMFRSLWKVLESKGIAKDDADVDIAISKYADAVQMLGHMNGV